MCSEITQYEISVVIPNYNNGKYLVECIKSIEKQSYPVKSIIVVDDCSTDNSLFILDSLKNEYQNLVIIPLKKNGKVSHARNVGLSYVETPYVTFIDADDVYINPQKIENEMSLIKNAKQTCQKDIAAYSRIEVLSSSGAKLYDNLYPHRYYLEGNIFTDVLTQKYAFTIMRDYCLPTEILRKTGGYNESNCFYEDLELILKLSKQIEFAYTRDVGTGYRQVHTGLSSRPLQEHIDKVNEIFEASIQDFPSLKKLRYTILRQIHRKGNTLIIMKKRALDRIVKRFNNKTISI